MGGADAAVTASCPGKVLVAGGYAILERPNQGLVLSTTARFHTTVAWQPREQQQQQSDADELAVTVVSPQYHQVIRLGLKVAAAGPPKPKRSKPDAAEGPRAVAANAVDVPELSLTHVQGPSNKYVETTVGFALSTAIFLKARWLGAQDLAAMVRNEGGCLDTMRFAEIMDVINFHFCIDSMAFSIGDVDNAKTANQNSLKVLQVAKTLGLDDGVTSKLWGEHTTSVLDDPEGTSHGNLRGFLKLGMKGVTFKGDGGVRSLSPGAARLVAEKGEIAPSKGAEAASAVLEQAANRECKVELKADNDFYSQQAHLKVRGLPYNIESLKQLPAFLPCCNEKGEAEVSKTGLGSSAAMVSSLVTALVQFFFAEIDQIDPAARLSTLHAVAQLAHGAIQGKIGSGFDVCAAVFGSMKYVRYDKQGLGPALSATTRAMEELGKDGVVCPGPAIIGDCLARLNHSVKPFQLPPRLQLMCGDVCGGSETPSMSRKILDWRSRAEGAELQKWLDLIRSNDLVADLFSQLDALAVERSDAYNAALDQIAASQGPLEALDGAGAKNAVMAKLLELRKAFGTVRRLLREIGDLADVPVEPACQTSLCDDTMAQAGVIISGVPGAGGFDAVFAVVVDAKRTDLASFWEARESQDGQVCALLLQESHEHPGIVVSRS